MAASRRKQTFKLAVKVRKRDLIKSIRDAEKAVIAGQKALNRAARKHDQPLFEANRLSLRDNRWVLLNLKSALDCLDDCCVDQFLNCDPTYEG